MGFNVAVPFTFNRHALSAYIHVLLRDQPIQHRKRFYTRVWRLRHPIVEIG